MTESSETHTNKPDCNMVCNKPTVFNVIDLPPAFGPEITNK